MSFQSEQLADALSKADSQDLVILTANLRQARQLSDYLTTGSKKDQGLRRSPTVRALSSWLEELWLDVNLSPRFDSAVDQRILIDSYQSDLLWTEVLAEAKDLPDLINSSDFVRQLKSAYEICESYLISDSELEQQGFDETFLYLRYRNRYREKLAKAHCIDTYQFLNLLIEFGTDFLDKQIFLYGFSDLSPLNSNVLHVLSSQPVKQIYLDKRSPNIDCFCCPSDRSELEFAALWAQKKLTDCRHNETKESIAIVVPDLAAQKQWLEGEFFKRLEPQRYIDQQATPVAESFDISAGTALDQTSLGQTLLLLPALLSDRIKKQDLLYLLQSPYWADGNSPIKQRLYASIVLCSESHINLFSHVEAAKQSPFTEDLQTESKDLQTDLFATEVDSEQEVYPSDTLAYVHSARRVKNEFNYPRSYDQWVAQIKQLMQKLGFPGPASLSSYEYQLIKRIFAALGEIAALDALKKHQVNFSDFEMALRLKLSTAIFHPEVKHPEVHIMGLMEAAGLQFDHCLIIGLTETALPSPAKPHPLLPITVQKKYNTPKSSAEREWQYAKAFLDALMQNTREISLSYHQLIATELAEPSSLIKEIASANGLAFDTVLGEPNPVENLKLTSLNYEDHQAITLGRAPFIAPMQTLRGGAYYLDLHWQNPLFAFFKYRLEIELSEPESVGLTGRERGNLIHDMLFSIYKRYDSKEKIRSLLATDNYHSLLRKQAETVVKQYNFANKVVPNTCLALEIENLVEVASSTLQFDAQRADSFSVHQLESSHEIEISEYVLSTRIDRIDSLGDALLVIDYKTGKYSTAGLIKSPITDHQLPLYATALNGKASAVAYMGLHTNDISLDGLADSQLNISELKSPRLAKSDDLSADWPALIAKWQSDITARVKEIVMGDVDYQPRSGTNNRFHQMYGYAVRPEELEYFNAN